MLDNANAENKTPEKIEGVSGTSLGQNIAKYDKKTDAGNLERIVLLHSSLIGLATYEEFSEFRGEFKSGYVKAKKCDVDSASKAFRRWFKRMNDYTDQNGKNPYSYETPEREILASSTVRQHKRKDKKANLTPEEKAQQKIDQAQTENLKKARTIRDRVNSGIQDYITRKKDKSLLTDLTKLDKILKLVSSLK